MSGSDWHGQRKAALVRMRRYAQWKRQLIKQLALRPMNNLRRRTGRAYSMLQTPSFK